LPFSTYSAPGALRQDPGRAAESPAEARTCGNQGFAKYVCSCRHVVLAVRRIARNLVPPWDSRCGCGHSARRSGCARQRSTDCGYDATARGVLRLPGERLDEKGASRHDFGSFFGVGFAPRLARQAQPAALPSRTGPEASSPRVRANLTGDGAPLTARRCGAPVSGHRATARNRRTGRKRPVSIRSPGPPARTLPACRITGCAPTVPMTPCPPSFTGWSAFIRGAAG